MPILKTECVTGCDGAPFNFAAKRVAACTDLPNFAAGTNTTLTGTGTAADPYKYNAAAGAVADGSETKVQAGPVATNPGGATVTGTGTTASPYVINVPAAAPATPLTIQDEGASLATAPTTIDFTGPRVRASGNGATKTVAVWGGEAPTTGAPATGPAAAPTFGQPLWATSTLGEQWHFIDGLGWRPLANLYGQNIARPADIAVPAGTLTTLNSFVAPRAGRMVVDSTTSAVPSGNALGNSFEWTAAILVNGTPVAVSEQDHFYAAGFPVTLQTTAVFVDVAAGDVVSVAGRFLHDSATAAGGNMHYQYVS